MTHEGDDRASRVLQVADAAEGASTSRCNGPSDGSRTSGAYARVDPAGVGRFVASHEASLPKLTPREALKHIG